VPGFGVDVTADEIGWGITGLAAAAVAAQVVGDIVRDKVRSKQATQETREPPQSGEA
jgi:hydrogenase small subunit